MPQPPTALPKTVSTSSCAAGERSHLKTPRRPSKRHTGQAGQADQAQHTAIGSERVEDGKPDEWRAMWESNVLGVLHVTQAFLPALRRSSTGSSCVSAGSVH